MPDRASDRKTPTIPERTPNLYAKTPQGSPRPRYEKKIERSNPVEDRTKPGMWIGRMIDRFHGFVGEYSRRIFPDNFRDFVVAAITNHNPPVRKAGFV